MGALPAKCFLGSEEWGHKLENDAKVEPSPDTPEHYVNKVKLLFASGDDFMLV
jgi:hypothetical protein